MPHPLILQLRFTRNEFQRGLAGLGDDDARRRFQPMNCISWNVGHLAWHTIIRAADPWLDTLTAADLLQPRAFVVDDQTVELTFGDLMQRVIYHYWYHTGENLAIRQLLGHTDLPEFVGDIDDEAPFRLP